ncbi:outer membrane protein TOM13 domain-containing protein [Neurospora intermedia]|uniref:Outer membrane protein TOM13 domain-containing protein n=1 Tax=Neurospora intermedia TaxID=5142 RepID=A0ABR3CZM7_NEUIN
MSAEEISNPLADSGVTISSDSEQYSAPESTSPQSPSSSSPAVVLYQPPTVWSLFRSAVINLFLPFVNGMMLGFGELFAHEAAFRLGWSNTKVFPVSRRDARPIGPGVEVVERPRRRVDLDDHLDELTSLE